MKDISPEMLAHLAEDTTTLAYLWKVVREDGQVFGFTSHDEQIVYDGVTYEASSGFMPTSIATNNGLAVDDVELEGILDSEAITQEDIMRGLWDRAEVFLYQVNYKDLTMGAIILRRGWLGEITAGTNRFNVELRGLNQRLQQQIGQNYSPICRASLGDTKCKFDLDTVIDSDIGVAEVTADNKFVDLEFTQFYEIEQINTAKIRFTSGANQGVVREVKRYLGAVDGQTNYGEWLELFIAPPYPIEVGDTVDFIPGCNKTLQMCRDIYDNVINFRGEPHVPVADTLIKGPKR